VIPAHVYVHAPFCARRCSYCDFAVTVDSDPPAGGWLEAVAAELDLVLAGGSPATESNGQQPGDRDDRVAGRASVETSAGTLETLYVGGGTPSLLGRGVMGGLAARLRRRVSWDSSGIEWTVEANPERFDEPLAADWLAAGVNRVSLGAQTFDAEVLRWMGRLHGPDGPGRAVAAARRAGFANVSIDLIFGVPSRLGRDWMADLERALALEPDHISLYGLTAETATPLGRWVADGREAMPPEEAYESEYLRAAERLTAEGFVHYEVSNFARPGRESRHNIAYWNGAAYLGLGPGAHSYSPPERRWNVRDWSEYRLRVSLGRSPAEDREVVDGAAASLERAWLGLRVREGIEAVSEAQRGLVETWLARGWAEPAGSGRVRLTPRGWLLLDRLAVEFDAAAAGGHERTGRARHRGDPGRVTML
jgi:oxygen-independent coproporphyrinogen-3 oxidase